MSEAMQITFRVFEGPGLLAPFASVVAEFADPVVAELPDDALGNHLSRLLPTDLARRITPQRQETRFESIVADLATAIQDFHGPNDLPALAQRAGDGSARVLLGYHDAQATLLALQAGLALAAAVFGLASGQRVDSEALTTRVRHAVEVMRLRQPDYIARALIRAARKLDIPVYPVSEGSRVWHYGQGAVGVQFFEAGNQFDALTGMHLARDKFLSNQLLLRLGLPGVRHGVAGDTHTALQIARSLGFPVVVKPLNSGKGQGVSVNVANEADLQLAFASANRYSPGAVIVERQVPGDDHRLVVLGGKLAWAVRRSPPQVVGDGMHSVAELIKLKNRARGEDAVAAGFAVRLELDADMRALLAAQGLGPEDRPESGRVVRLRGIANTATGGTITECTATLHPDNRDMAETIARAFRLDTVGIDFMTTDIGRSWREGECAVIEVNATPGFSSDGRAETLLADKFAQGANGRIPSIVLVGATPVQLDRFCATMVRSGLRIGCTDSAQTRLANQTRFTQPASVASRTRALLLDPTCEALLVGVSAAEITQQGFPLDRCDLALVFGSPEVSAPLRKLIADCAGTVLAFSGAGEPDDQAMAAVKALLERRQRMSSN